MIYKIHHAHLENLIILSHRTLHTGLQDFHDLQDSSCKSCKSCKSCLIGLCIQDCRIFKMCRINLVNLGNHVNPVSHDLKLAFAQHLNAIAELRSPLKLKPLRRTSHLQLQSLDRRFNVRR